jgi:hypothetical protein
VVASNDDPYCSLERARHMARDWGSTFSVLGARGHVNSESGLGDWPEGLAMLEQLAGRAKR